MDTSIFSKTHSGKDAVKVKATKNGKGFSTADERTTLYAAMKAELGPFCIAWDIARAWIEGRCEAVLGKAPVTKDDWAELSTGHHGWKLHDPKRTDNAFPEAYARGEWQVALVEFCREAWAELEG